MKNNNDRINSIKNKVKCKQRQRNIRFSVTASALCIAAIFTVVCSLPILSAYPAKDISAYTKDAYYPLISKLNSYDDCCAGNYKYSIFDKVFNGLSSGTDSGDLIPPTDNEESPSVDKNKYEETTLNQVNGVIEADILKRTDRHVFYLSRVSDRELKLDVYALNGANTNVVATYSIAGSGGMRLYFDCNAVNELYLSENGDILTVLTASKTADDKSDKSYVTYTTVISLDVSDVENIAETGRKYVSGKYLSSRKVDGKLLVITDFSVNYNYDFDNKRTYVPACGNGAEEFIDMCDVYLPETVTERTYTVIAEFDENTLEVDSCRALLSYYKDVFVSGEHIFVTRNEQCYYDKQFSAGNEIADKDVNKLKKENLIYCHTTDIVTLDYKTGISIVGCVKINGSILDRYCMDEKDGVLRVFVTTDSYVVDNLENSALNSTGRSINVSLFCIDISSMNVVSCVESFAPEGDEVKSARFDGNTGWVCTALRNTDPVYRFDLSDVYNIPTPSKTNEIPGFSTSLTAFGDDMLLGIGRDNGNVKIEMYRQDGSKIIPVAKYQAENCSYSADFKAYLIDAEHNLIGLGLYDYNKTAVTDNAGQRINGNSYLLLNYNQEEERFEVVYKGKFDTGYDYVRAFYLDKAVYLFGNGFEYIPL